MVTVFITDGNLRSSLAVARSLGKQNVNLVCGESSRFATTFYSKYVGKSVVYPDPSSTPSSFISFVKDLVQSRQIDVIIPIGHETSKAINRNSESLKRHTKVPMVKNSKFETAINKNKVVKIADKLEIPCPKSQFITSKNELISFKSRVGIPIVVKPIDGSGSRGIHFIESSSDFKRFLYGYTGEKMLVQEMIPRDGDGLGAGFLFDHGECVAEFSYRRIREFPLEGGPSTCRESTHNSEIIAYGKKLLEELDWHGVSMVEFKLDPRSGQPQLMEINPRFWGSLHLPIYSGVDFPKMLLELALDKDVCRQNDYESGVTCRYILPGDILHLLSKRDYKSLRNFIKFKNTHYDILDKDDPAPTVGRLMSIARHSINPRMWQKAVFRSNYNSS